MLYTSTKFFETLGVIRIKHRLTKSNIFLDDESEDFDDKDFAVNRKSKCDSDATQKGKVVTNNNNIFKENNNEKNNVSPHAWHKDLKKKTRSSLYFSYRKTKENFSAWVSLKISLIFLPTWTNYHLNYFSYDSK